MAWLCKLCKTIDDELLIQYHTERANTEAMAKLRKAQHFYRVKNFVEAVSEEEEEGGVGGSGTALRLRVGI